MRVLSLVTLVSPDGAFGGPVRVAENHAAALRARGHEVTVAAGSRGFAPGTAPTTLGGAPLHLFPAAQVLPGAGFSGLTAPGLLRWVRRAARAHDVVHVHLARDLVTLPAAALVRRAAVPYVVQPHGMVVASDNPLSRPLDAALTRRVLTGAAATFVLTPAERAGVAGVCPPADLVDLGNGVPDPGVVATPRTGPVRVLYLARLQARKRADLLARTARTLIADGLDASFALVGPDEGLGEAVRREVDAVGDAGRLRWEGALPPDRTLERLRDADLFVLPSVDEPYPMSVLEALSVGLPVVITDSCGLADAVRTAGAGRVVDATPAALEAAVRELVVDHAARAEASAAALRLVAERFGVDAIAQRLEQAYAQAVARTL